MDNSQQPAYPQTCDANGNDADVYGGFTKLEAFTMAAMQGLLSQDDSHLFLKISEAKGCTAAEALARTAIDVARATLTELSKQL